MQEPMFSSTITKRFYNERSVLIGTFLGGPLVGGYLIAQNFKALDESAKAVKAWLVAIVALLIVLATAFIPALDKVPSIIYSFLYCMMAHYSTRKFQGAAIELHQVNGGRLHSTGRAAAIGFIGLVLMVGVYFGLLYLTDPATSL